MADHLVAQESAFRYVLVKVLLRFMVSMWWMSPLIPRKLKQIQGKVVRPGYICNMGPAHWISFSSHTWQCVFIKMARITFSMPTYSLLLTEEPMHSHVTALPSGSNKIKMLEIFFRNKLPSVWSQTESQNMYKSQLQFNGPIVCLHQGLSVRGAQLLVPHALV